jgi:hypothetical protein
MQTALGYSVAVGPEYRGLAVEKVLGHDVHGKVVRSPRHQRLDRAYQRLVTNGGEFLEEFRVDVYGRGWIWTRKRMPKNKRGFPLPGRRRGDADWAVDPTAYASMEELVGLRLVLAELGLEYGSLDVIRDEADGRLYVIDATVATGVPEWWWHTNVSAEQYARDVAQAFELMWR